MLCKRPPHELRRLAKSEAAAFYEFTRRGVLSAEEAIEYLGITAEQRAFLERFAARSDNATAGAIRDAIDLRDRALAEFLKLADLKIAA